MGEKTALQLIEKYETLDGVYEHLDELKPALKTKLENGREMAYLSKQLVTLMVDMPLKIDLEECRLDATVTPEFVAMLKKLEFSNLLRQVEHQVIEEVTAAPAKTGEKPTAATKKAVETQQAALGLIAKELEPAEEIAFDARVLQPGEPRLLAANPENSQVWVSVNDKQVMSIDFEALTPDVIQLLVNGPVIGHDLKSLFRALLVQDTTWKVTVGHDTRIGAFLLNSLIRSRELADIIQHPIEAENAGEVIAGIWQAYHEQKEQFNDMPEVARLAHDVEFPSIFLLAKMEHRGVLLDSDYLNAKKPEFDARIKSLEDKISRYSDEPINVSSTRQLSSLLFDKLGLPKTGIKKTSTGFYSTGVNELNKLMGKHEIIQLIADHRVLSKLKNSYIDTLPKQVDTHSKLHTTYNLDVAATGRLSSKDPNLQQIPMRTDLGREVRSAFIPAEGNVFVSADYSQFELRLAAVMANDQKLINDFNQGIDIHQATAAEVYGIPLDDVTKDMRRHAKTVNFGVLYGMSPHGLSIAANMSMHEAKQFIERYFEVHAPIKAYMNTIVEQGLANGYVSTLCGRRRPTPDLKSSNFVVREAAKRAAINMPIQGTEADLMKMAMLAVEQKLLDANLGEQILQVHDSIIVECPAANAEKVAELLKTTMENIYELPVKLAVDVSTGKTWGDL